MIGTAEWSELFQKHDFFHRYHNYLQVIASTGDPATQLKWYVSHFFQLSSTDCSITKVWYRRVPDKATDYETRVCGWRNCCSSIHKEFWCRVLLQRWCWVRCNRSGRFSFGCDQTNLGWRKRHTNAPFGLHCDLLCWSRTSSKAKYVVYYVTTSVLSGCAVSWCRILNTSNLVTISQTLHPDRANLIYHIPQTSSSRWRRVGSISMHLPCRLSFDISRGGVSRILHTKHVEMLWCVHQPRSTWFCVWSWRERGSREKVEADQI